MLNVRKELCITGFIHTVEVNGVFPSISVNPTYRSRTQSSPDLTFPLDFVETPVSVQRGTEFSKSEQQPVIPALQNGNSYIRNQGCEESSIPRQLLQKSWDEQPQHLSNLSHFPWTPSPVGWCLIEFTLLSYARNWNEAADLKTSKKESLSSQYQLSSVWAYTCPNPTLRDTGFAVKARYHYLPTTPMVPGCPLPSRTDGSDKLWREPAWDSHGFQRELDDSQGEFPLQRAVPRYGAS